MELSAGLDVNPRRVRKREDLVVARISVVDRIAAVLAKKVPTSTRRM
jgi:hypothetical protein